MVGRSPMPPRGEQVAIVIRVSKRMRHQLQQLSRRTGRSQAYYMRTALQSLLSEAEKS